MEKQSSIGIFLCKKNHMKNIKRGKDVRNAEKLRKVASDLTDQVFLMISTGNSGTVHARLSVTPEGGIRTAISAEIISA